MSDQQQILPCVVCSQQHQQMLMLSCLHDPCINCASIHYVQTAPKNSLFYPCSKCNQQTQLDTSSVVQLQRVYRTLKPSYQDKKYNYNRNISSREKDSINSIGKNSRSKIHENTNSNIDTYSYNNMNMNSNSVNNNTNSHYTVNSNKSQKYGNTSIASDHYQPSLNGPYSYNKPEIIQKSYTHTNNNNNTNNNINNNHSNYYTATTTSIAQKKNLHPTTYLMCHQHPEDELTYFCFTCNKPICPQCAIHGAHREHEVQTTRRAIKQIKSRLSQFTQKISTQIGNLMHRKQQSRKCLKQLSDIHKHDHQQVKKQFNRLRTVLIQKQKQLLHQITINYDQNCQSTKNFTLQMDKLIQTYNNTRKNIDITLKRDDLTVLQQFNKREDQANQILQKNINKAAQEKLIRPQQIDVRGLEENVREVLSNVEEIKVSFEKYQNRRNNNNNNNKDENY